MMNRKMIALISAIVFATGMLTVLSACGSGDENGKTTDSTNAISVTDEPSTDDRTVDTVNDDTSTAALDELPDEDRIREDLIGWSMEDPHLGEWIFEDEEEFVEFEIVDKEKSRDADDFEIVTFVIEVKLQDINDGKLYNGQMEVVYEQRAQDMPWRLIDVSGEYRSAQPSV